MALVVGELPLVVRETFGANGSLLSARLAHLDRVLLLQVGRGFMQLRSLLMGSGCAQVNGQRVPPMQRLWTVFVGHGHLYRLRS